MSTPSIPQEKPYSAARIDHAYGIFINITPDLEKFILDLPTQSTGHSAEVAILWNGEQREMTLTYFLAAVGFNVG